ncbi:MAG TPA: hypothetical protein VNV65_00090 [Candidatus Solibacter sp.]|jgi:hypothetical protein|nr:hypothetical protein [Candidatus Solibacter sp.]
MKDIATPFDPQRRSAEERNVGARAALVAYLRLLAACIEDEADMLEEEPARAGQLLARFRSEVLDMTLGDAPVEALLQRTRQDRVYRKK